MADGNKKWVMNATQTKFINILKENPDGITLFELKLAGTEIKTGSINTLITKGLVTADGEKEFACDIVYNGVKVGTTTKVGKVYKLVG